MRPSQGRSPFAHAWFGPPSVVAVAVGICLAGVPWLVSVPGPALWLFGWPMAGCLALPFRGAVRQFGVGMVVSILTVPVFAVMAGTFGMLV